MSVLEVMQRERAALCDTFAEVGPDAPTLCDGWLTADLAAHMVARETRPDAALGMFVPPLAKHLDNVMHQLEAKGYEWMVDKLRSGPPFLHRAGPMARANVNENWIHHEDIRRARGDGPRVLDEETDGILWDSLKLASLISGRRIKGAGLTLLTPDSRTRVIKDVQPMVTVTGEPGELVLFMSGRKEAAAVAIDGEPEAIAIVRATKFGV
ncbi:MAG: TIGR03085 family metal-binding protein [Actinomycetota bacterium]|nr:TIGR03085 family metal-binding protein [Actinomycetota bacterium]